MNIFSTNNVINKMSFFSFDEIFNPTPQNKNSFKIEFETNNILSFHKNINTTYHISYISKYISDTGSFIIIINSDKQDKEDSVNAIFCISRSNKLSKGSVNKLTGSDQNNNEDNLSIEWNAGEYPCLIYHKCAKNINRYNSLKFNNKSSKIIFYIKVIST